MIEVASILTAMQKRTNVINQVVMIVGPIAVLVGGYYWYREKIWEPTVTINNVNWEKGEASVTVNGQPMPLYAGSTLAAKYGWGVRFAGKTTDSYDRIELLKNDYTKRTLIVK